MVMSATKTSESIHCSPTKSQNKAEHKSYDMLKALLCLSLAHPGTPLHFSFEGQWTQSLRKPNLNGSAPVKHSSLGLQAAYLHFTLLTPSRHARSYIFILVFLAALSLSVTPDIIPFDPPSPHCAFQSSARFGSIFVKRHSASPS